MILICFVTLTFGFMLSHVQAVSLARTMFLPNDPAEKPYFDEELEFLIQNTSISRWHLNNKRQADYLQDLLNAERNDQLESQAEMDTFNFLGLLGNGPATVNLLGQIMVLSSKKDFSFISTSPNYKFQYIKHSDSFRATLSQIANDAYGAFQSAHSNMDQIQLYMQQIPGYVKTALKLLATAPFMILEKMLPTSLNNIDRVGTECSDFSLTTYNKFADVELLLGEVIELTIKAHGTTEQMATNASIDLTVSKTEKEQLNNKEADIRRRYESAIADVKSAQELYKDQLKKVPNVWEALTANIAGAVVSTFNKITSMQKPECIVRDCAPPMQDYSKHGAAGAESALSHLQSAQKRYDDIFLELMQHHDRITQVMIRIASLDMAKLEYEELIPIMQEAVQYLDEIKVHWGKLLRFFDGLRIRVKASVNGSIKNFVDWMKQAQATGEDALTPVIREYYMEFMKEDTIAIHREAHLLYIMARTYYDVSTEYLMDQLAGLNKLLVASTDEQRNALKNELMRDTDTVRLRVRKLAEMRKQEYLQANQNRQEELEQFMMGTITQGIGRKRRQILFLH